VGGNIAIKAIFTAKIAKRRSRLYHYRQRRHYLIIPLLFSLKDC
jgi:hypothetical protein